MRIVLVHPNYHSGGAEIAGNWPPAWVAYLAGALRNAGYDDIHFLDAMTNHIEDDELRARIAELQPDIVGTTAITPSIYTAERGPRDSARCGTRGIARHRRRARHVHVQAGPERIGCGRRRRSR